MSIRESIAKKVAKWIKPGQVVNLGIGIPLEVLAHAPHWITFHNEGGALGIAHGGDDTIDSGGRPCRLCPGGSYMDSAVSFGMIRRGLVDVAVIGAFQVDFSGGVYNHRGPDGSMVGYGGGIELGRYAKSLIVAMTHFTKGGRPKIVASRIAAPTFRRDKLLIITEQVEVEIDHGRITVLSGSL